MNPIRVAVVEDDPNWLKVITSFLRKHKDIKLVGTAISRNDAIQLAKSVEIDVMLMDINLSADECDGIHAVLDILAFKEIKIMMLTSLKSENIIKDSFTAGAVNFISKDDFEDIPFCIRRCLKDSFAFDILVKEFGKLKKEEQLKDLSESEKEVFGLLEKGYKQTQIEDTLFKTHNTLRAQIRSILKKINVKSSREAVIKVASKGLRSYV